MTTEKSPVNPDAPTSVLEDAKGLDNLLAAKSEEMTKTEVSAVTVARMMGVATSKELKLLEGKIDLLSGRITSIAVRIERALTVLNNVPTGADIERIDVQIASLRTLLQNFTPNGDTAHDDGDTKVKMDAFIKRNQGGGTDGGSSEDKND